MTTCLYENTILEKRDNMIQRIIVILFKISTIFFLVSFFLFPFKSIFAATFDIVAGDVYGSKGLVAAINVANVNTEADTINLASGSTYTLTAVDNVFVSGPNGLPLIRSEIIINGNGATIQRNAASPLFRVLQVDTPGKLTLNGLTVSNGYSQHERGGGISNYGILTINASTFSNNFGAYGGGIVNESGGTLALNGSNVAGNRTDLFGGGVFIDRSSTATVNASTFSNNSSSEGGGIFNNGLLTITNSTLIGNKDSGGFVRSGGAVFNGPNGTVSLNSSTVSGNVMTGGLGGGVYNQQGGTVNIIASTLSSNNSALTGGGIYNEFRGTVTIANSKILDHSLGGGYGAGIFNEGGLSVKDSTISGNITTGGFVSAGGGIFNSANGAVALTNSTLSSNSASINGGGISNQGAMNINGSAILNNSSSTGIGGGVFNQRVTLNVTESMFSGNSSTLGGGIFNNTGTAIIDKSTFLSNSAIGTQNSSGGGIYNGNLAGDAIGSTLTIANSTFSDNSASFGGAIVNLDASNLSVTNSIFTYNNISGSMGSGIANFSTAIANNNCMVGNTSQSIFNYYNAPVLDATNSWWGTATGPTHASNPSGAGDSVSDNVQFTPWLTTPPSFCPNLYLNRPPTASVGGPYNVPEGGIVTLNGSGSDPDGDPLTFTWDLDNNGTFETLGQSVTFSAAGLDGPSSKIVVLQACDNKGACATSNATVTITNVAPTVGIITAPLDPVLVNTAISTSVTFNDPGVLDTHTAVWDWGDGNTSAGAVTEVDGSGSVTGNHAYTTAGVFTLKLTVTDKDGASSQSVFQHVVVYDPNAGFATGGGLIDSPTGAYVPDQSLSNKANIGFSIRYQPGVTVPTGQTQFHLKDALRFQSTNYEWLVVSGSKAQFKGSGIINGSGNYTFLVTVIDGQITGGGGVDKFRIKITDNANNAVVYDNQTGAADTVDPTATLLAGSIVIH